MFRKLLHILVILIFTLNSLQPIARSQSVPDLPAPGSLVNLSPSYEPALIKGLTVHKDNPLLFDFIVDSGNKAPRGILKKDADRLIKYFFACLTIPEKDLWVNLSPYEKKKIVPKALGQTALGRDLLAEDYILKQLTASLIYPEKDLGKEFWDRIYSKSRQMFGTAQIPVNTFNKVWIVADKATVYEHGQSAFVVNGHMKVMLEEDYLSLIKHKNGSPIKTFGDDKTQLLTSNIIRQIILPEIEKEVNTGKNFTVLRQIFNSLVLATWYKRSLKEALLNKVYANQSMVNGIKRPNSVNQHDLSPNQIYNQYLQAYKKGVFNYVKEDTSIDGPSMPRKYFSGGFVSALDETIVSNSAMATQVSLSNNLTKFTVSEKIALGNSNAAMADSKQYVIVSDTGPGANLRSLTIRVGQTEHLITVENRRHTASNLILVSIDGKTPRLKNQNYSPKLLQSNANEIIQASGIMLSTKLIGILNHNVNDLLVRSILEQEDFESLIQVLSTEDKELRILRMNAAIVLNKFTLYLSPEQRVELARFLKDRMFDRLEKNFSVQIEFIKILGKLEMFDDLVRLLDQDNSTGKIGPEILKALMENRNRIRTHYPVLIDFLTNKGILNKYPSMASISHEFLNVLSQNQAMMTLPKRPKIAISDFTKNGEDGSREFYAFLPPDGYYSVTFKIGGSTVAGTVLDSDGRFMLPALSVPSLPNKRNNENFEQYLSRLAKEQKKSRKIIRERLWNKFIDHVSQQIMTQVNSLSPEVKERISLVGISSPGPFVGGSVDRRGVFDDNSSNLPYIKGRVLSDAIRDNLRKKGFIINRVEILHDAVAALEAEINKRGTRPGAKNLTYWIWGTGVGQATFFLGKLFSGGKIVNNLLGEIGHHLVYFPDGHYEWVAVQTKGQLHDLSGKFFASFKDVENRLGGLDLSQRFNVPNTSKLNAADIHTAGLEMGRAIGVYLKAVYAQYGVEIDDLIIGSGVSHLGQPLLDAVNKGVDDEFNRPLQEEWGYKDGLTQVHGDLLGQINSAKIENREPVRHNLYNEYGALYVKTYLIAQETSQAMASDGLNITPDLVNEFRYSVRYWTATGRPGAGKGELMLAFIKKMNTFLPADEQIQTVVMGDYFRGIERVVKQAETKDQPKTPKELAEEAMDREKYGYYVQFLDVPEDINDMNAGRMIKDSTALLLINKIFEREPEITNAKYIYFDGFPRTPAQWEMVKEKKIHIGGKPLVFSFILDIDFPEHAAEKRIQARTESEAQFDSNKVRQDGKDTETIARRQREFIVKTLPMINDMRKQQNSIHTSSYFPYDIKEVSIRKTREGFIDVLSKFLHVNEAMSNTQTAVKEPFPGGIDLNASNMSMSINKDASSGVQLANIDSAMINRIMAQGIHSAVPVIISMTPMTNADIRPLLGLT